MEKNYPTRLKVCRIRTPKINGFGDIGIRMEDTLANAALPITRFGDVGIRTDDEKCACNEHLAVFQMMKLLDFQEIETLLAPYFLQKAQFFIFLEKTCFFKQSDRFWRNATSRRLCFF